MCLQIYLEKEKQITLLDSFEQYSQLELLHTNNNLIAKKHKRAA